MPSGFAAGFAFDDDEFQRFVERVDDEWPSHRAAILDALAEDLAGELRREIPTSSGAAKSTIRTVGTKTPGPAEVVAGGMRGVDYIEPLLEGSEPHAPGPPTPAANPSLARWARREGYPGGFESIYWSIYHYGTEPHDFVSGPVAETQSRAGDIAERVLERREVLDR
jgi:hypothetical protein